MWFLFGFLTLSLCMLGSYIARQAANWKPQESSAEGYEYKLKRYKSRVTGVLFGIKGLRDYNFTVKHETWYDRLFKKLGVSNEVQTGDDEFDQLVYVVSDNSLIHEKLVGSVDIRRALKSIFYFGGSQTAKVKKLECRKGRLWIEFSTKDQISEANVKYVIADPLLASLKIIAKELNQLKQTDYKRWLDPFVYKGMVVLGISTGVAINAAIHLARISFGDFPYLISNTELIWHSVFTGIFIVAILVVFALYWMKNSSRTHLVLIELISIGLLGAIGSAFHELRDVNMEWNQGLPKVMEAKLLKHYTTTSRTKNGRRTNYHLVFNDWNCNCEKTIHKQVSYSTYRKLISYSDHQVIQYEGTLGYPWIVNIQPVNNP
jgi:hypothetical protein